MTRRAVGTWRHRPGERGQVTAMLVVFAVCLLLAVVAVTDLSAAYLRKQSALSLADGAALAATDAAAAASVYRSVDDGFVPIDQDAAAAAVQQYLAQTGAYAEYPGLQAAVSVEGPMVTVRLAMPFRLPVPVPGVAPTTLVHGSASAALPVYD